MDTFKVMMLLSCLRSINSLTHDFKSPFLDRQLTIASKVGHCFEKGLLVRLSLDRGLTSYKGQ